MNQKPRILVVDDDACYRQLLTYLLTQAGYEVLLAREGQEALSWLDSVHHRPDLVLLDLLMPQLSGIEVIQHIRTLPYKIPVILISGAEQPIAREGVSIASPDAFLPKPFVIQSLLELIEALLQQVKEI
jgi:DNA-binding response OmpR family regulator